MLRNIKPSRCAVAALCGAFVAFGLYQVHSLSGVTEGGVLGLNLLLELCLPLVRVGGYFIAMKALTAPDEIDEAKNALCTLGASVDRVINYTLTDGSETLSRSIIIIKKTTHTPPKYPRNNSQISKKPL